MPTVSKRRKQLIAATDAKKRKLNTADVCPTAPIVKVPHQRRKLLPSGPPDDAGTSAADFTHFICSVNRFTQLIEAFPCKECFANDVRVSFKAVRFSAVIVIICNTCNFSYQHEMSDSNLSMAIMHGSSQIGLGQKQMNMFASVVGLPLVGQTHYSNVMRKVLLANSKSMDETLQRSRSFVYEKYLALGVIPDRDDCIEIDISYDGSWMSRVFSSQYGVGAVIECLTGLILDVAVLSKYCHKCKFAPIDDTLEAWKIKHLSECQKNYNGSSSAMEMSIAAILWKRSIDNGKFIYKTMLSDGDAKTIVHLNSQDIYGNGLLIEKRECVNHVAKRLGTALRKVRQSAKIGGAGEGKLTEIKIKKLTNYYGNAIRSNCHDISLMKSAILATVLHCSSTDQEPRHSKCPKSLESWCFYQRAKSNNELPEPHKSKLKTFISEDVFKCIMPIYTRLSTDELLKRCINGGTQNDNESFHHMLWNRCPKHKFCGKQKVELAVFVTVSSYNCRVHRSLNNQLQLMNLPVSKQAQMFFKRNDEKRIQDSARKALMKSKRFIARMQQIREEEDKKRAEGVSYAAGEF